MLASGTQWSWHNHCVPLGSPSGVVVVKHRRNNAHPMVESSPKLLDRLSQQCAECLRQGGQRDCEPCRKLAYRALCGGNDAAWDMMVVHLWPFVLRWIYATLPEVTPAVAEMLGYRALWNFRSHYALRPTLATNFPSFPALLTELHHITVQLTAHSSGTG